MDEGIARSFARIEFQLDQLGIKMDRYGERIAEHAVRLGHVEDDVKELQAAKTADVRQGMTLRAGITVALFGATTSGLVSFLVTLANKGG